MGVLTSDLFTNADDVVVSKLENCATGSPSEMASHFKFGDSGPHIRKVQIALNNYKAMHRSDKIGDFKIDGEYSKEFAEAIAQYKTIKKIPNLAKQIDDIVGKKTIISLDKEEKGGEEPLPLILPPPEPTEKRRRFTRRVFIQSTRSGGDGKPDDGLKDIFSGLLTLGQNLQDSTFALGTESVSQRSITVLNIGEANPTRVEKNIVTEVRQTPTGTDTLTSAITTTEIKYFYGPRSESRLIVATSFSSTINGSVKNQESRTEFIPMNVARLDFGLVPPDP